MAVVDLAVGLVPTRRQLDEATSPAGVRIHEIPFRKGHDLELRLPARRKERRLPQAIYTWRTGLLP